MSLLNYSRMDSKTVLETFTKLPSIFNATNYAASSRPKIVYKPKEASKSNESYDMKNARLKRPLSPHFSIYAPQVTSVLSISNRFAGIILSGYLFALGLAALTLPNDISHYIENMQISSGTLFLTKAVIVAPWGYHFASGLRHLYWDMGKGLTIKEVYTSGYATLAVTVVTTIILAIL